MLEEREAEMHLLRNKLEKLQMGTEGCKVPVEAVHPPPIQLKKGNTRSGSAFGCIKMNHQVHLELEEERKTYQRRIQELEDVLQNHEDEVTMLHEKLADAESMTRDVLRVLRGVKTDMTNVVVRKFAPPFLNKLVFLPFLMLCMWRRLFWMNRRRRKARTMTLDRSRRLVGFLAFRISILHFGFGLTNAIVFLAGRGDRTDLNPPKRFH